MTLVELAAVAATLLIAGAAAFQLALAAGLPLGAATMGGRAPTIDGVLQPLYRAIAAGSAFALLFAAWVVLGRAGIVAGPIVGQGLGLATWAVAAFMALNTFTNLFGRHPLERWGMASITFLAAILVGYVAYAPPS
jgi:hypothetical protein